MDHPFDTPVRHALTGPPAALRDGPGVRSRSWPRLLRQRPHP